MSRLLFAKEGSAIYISHLDLMRAFQRSFRRAGLMLKHTQGFTPHAMVSIALPLSVGVSSECEFLDFELAEDCKAELLEIVERLNAALPSGIRVLKAYDGGRKVRELTFLQVQIQLEYDYGVPKDAAGSLNGFFSGGEVLVEKKGKNGITEIDIAPMIKEFAAEQVDGHTVTIESVICAQNPSLNPALIPAAIGRYLPELRPDFAVIRRCDALCADGSRFR